MLFVHLSVAHENILIASLLGCEIEHKKTEASSPAPTFFFMEDTVERVKICTLVEKLVNVKLLSPGV